MNTDPINAPKSEEIDESLDNLEKPDTLAEATTASLDDDALGGHANGSASTTDK